MTAAQPMFGGAWFSPCQYGRLSSAALEWLFSALVTLTRFSGYYSLDSCLELFSGLPRVYLQISVIPTTYLIDKPFQINLTHLGSPEQLPF
ncbi:hypothetical protein LSAT2_012985 [Lamellibrachia satsuma]|nr:hypothetical protein LSAT2_012985 [Lamellibrachia satsuma]